MIELIVDAFYVLILIGAVLCIIRLWQLSP